MILTIATVGRLIKIKILLNLKLLNSAFLSFNLYLVLILERNYDKAFLKKHTYQFVFPFCVSLTGYNAVEKLNRCEDINHETFFQ